MANTNRVREQQSVSGPVRKVLLIHGRDELNLLRLKGIFRDRPSLTTVILNDEPAQGLTLIEKFERLATDADFSFALMTPDDFVEFEKRHYRQARPNVYFELGWAYSRFGRSRVCVLLKKGTNLPTDLHGIHRIEFVESVNEVVPQIESELRSASTAALDTQVRHSEQSDIEAFLAESRKEKISVELPDDLHRDLIVLRDAMDGASVRLMIERSLRDYIEKTISNNIGIRSRVEEVRGQLLKVTSRAS